MNDKKIILSSQDIHDNIIVVAINLIQMEFPILAIQSPSLSLLHLALNTVLTKQFR